MGNTGGHRLGLDQGGLSKPLQYKHFAYNGIHIVILLTLVELI